MCGIVGYIGNKNGVPVIINGLERLEYRGYDSAGLAVSVDGNIEYRKKVGRLQNLEDSLNESPLSGDIAIGHTRWATHGVPSEVNSHPHFDNKHNTFVVHNGIIENYLDIKERLGKDDYQFISDTDTEVVAALVEYNFQGDLLEAVNKTTKEIKGSYALGIIHKNCEELIATRCESPLLIGVGDGEFFIASDVSAIIEYTRDIIYLENNDIARLTKTGVEIFDENLNSVNREIKHIDWSIEAATKEGFDHFMIKEIFQQPKAIEETFKRRLNDQGRIVLDNITFEKEELLKFNKAYIVACGTAYNAGLACKTIIEEALHIPVIPDIASEFRYNPRYIDDKTLVIILSQSGETADTLAALRLSKEQGATVISITNVMGSSIARESHKVIYTWAGPEIAVASTKAYTTQIVALYMLSMEFGLITEHISKDKYDELVNGLLEMSDKVKSFLENIKVFETIADNLKETHSLFYIGRGLDSYTAMEGALKLKEISYIHTESFPAGELKHGTIALIEEGTPVIALATQDELYEKMISNIKEVKARGAYVIGITTENHKDFDSVVDQVIYLPQTMPRLMPILSVVPTQLIAYYASIAKGNDVDKPRNLAKSVTVE